jgi:hypothetical protein
MGFRRSARQNRRSLTLTPNEQEVTRNMKKTSTPFLRTIAAECLRAAANLPESENPKAVNRQELIALLVTRHSLPVT